ncbi:uncharacterized protein LOC142786352 [Rhipicephalus microplus]|uniref:uncharacterized protein LOC142786352 n=1 Tax=Rhipicephalus microplus TaxID=6941 RepID=UPI003F6ACEDE
MDSTTDTPLVRSVTPSSDATTATLTPSEYERSFCSITPEFTTLTNSRERFVVLSLSALLLFISGCLFGILVSLLSDDLSFIPTVISKQTPEFFLLISLLSRAHSRLPWFILVSGMECSIILRCQNARTSAGARDERLQCSRCCVRLELIRSAQRYRV